MAVGPIRTEGEVDFMQINVTKHAIRRYQERLFDYSSSDERIVGILREIAHKGVFVRSRMHHLNNCREIKYRGISIVTIEEPSQRIVITCLGDAPYRKWVKTKGTKNKLSLKVLLDVPLSTCGQVPGKDQPI